MVFYLAFYFSAFIYFTLSLFHDDAISLTTTESTE